MLSHYHHYHYHRLSQSINSITPESSGKTTLAVHAIAEVQRRGGRAAFIDAEHSLDATYAASLGVDLDSLLVHQPEAGEDALEVADTLMRSRAVDMIVVDSGEGGERVFQMVIVIGTGLEWWA